MLRLRRPSHARPSAARVPLLGHGLQAPPTLIWLALGALYIIWGSTYLAIRKTIETIPPLLSASARFIVAGAILYLWAVRRGDREGDRLTTRHWISATVVGGLLLLGGNGGVVWAERTVPTGIVALIVATVPLWMAILDRVVFGQRLALQAVAGLVLGFGGLVLLVGGPGGRFHAAGVTVTVGSALSWAVGSMYARRASLPKRSLVATGMEMMAGGVLLGLAGIAGGEIADVDPSRFSLESLLGLAYLVVFGSWIGFASYLWLLRVAPVSLVSTYAYVNPVIAVLLGWALLSEAVSGRTLIAGVIIVVAVALIITARAIPPPGDPAEGAPQPAELDGNADSG